MRELPPDPDLIPHWNDAPGPRQREMQEQAERYAIRAIEVMGRSPETALRYSVLSIALSLAAGRTIN